ncbi:hypothetical protein CC86DRAFT_371865 [Ophiobolus disseminans]|uniref:2EXR domain-containing protein n=1 Tax=Ophiobolus disseminans TaxID=1469910 RepID=A0A6A6ZUU0_9PLEO|nr:hypothetical protein CC86DRAFT_371865 [Ophiobolus disseminans]
MSFSPASTAIFHLFPNLAAELRNQIWHDALPDTTTPALVPWKPGFWYVREAEPEIEWRPAHDLIIEVPIEMPTAFANHEARSIALAYVRDLQLKTVARGQDQNPVFTRPFEPLNDALLMQPSEIEAIAWEAAKRLYQDDMEGVHLSAYSDLKSIAMSATCLRRENAMQYVVELLDYYTSVDTLFVVVNDELDDQACAFEPAPGDAYEWTGNLQEFVRGTTGLAVGDGVVESLVCTEEVKKAFSQAGIGQPWFVVRPVRAIRT